MKVFVGLSGGVDSAVSAYLLKKAGHDVTGVFLKVWEPDFLPCTSGEDKLDAMRVAAHLEIPFKTYNLEKEYKEEVVDYFVNEYKEGRTPNPDVMCNRSIKFGAFWEKAKKDGAEAIATGHYAQVREGQGNEKISLSERTPSESFAYSRVEDGEYAMLRGLDESKDQSYFLWTLTQEDLKHSLFPVGELEKSEVRKIADEAGLPNAKKRDSQGLCFLGHVDMEEFLKHYIPVKEGVVKDEGGKEVAKHIGVSFYTLSQRFPVPGDEKKYIIKKDLEKNELIVSSYEHEPDSIKELDMSNVNWISQEPKDNETYYTQIRYHGEKFPTKIKNNTVFFEKPILAASGQSLVVYTDDGECLGGGIIG